MSEELRKFIQRETGAKLTVLNTIHVVLLIFILVIGWGITIGMYQQRMANLEKSVEEIERWMKVQNKENYELGRIIDHIAIKIETIEKPK